MATLQKNSEKGNRIFWRLCFPDGTSKPKYKNSKSNVILHDLMPDIMKIETLSRRSEITPEDLIRALNLKIITREEMVAFGKTVQAHEDHYLHELREDFENKSKTESSASYCHKVNLYRADKLEEYFKGTPMAQITPEAIDTYRVGRLKTVCQTTVNHDLKILRKYLDIAVSKGWIRANTARATKLMKEPKGRVPRCLYPDEHKVFFEKLPDYKHLLHGHFEFIVKILLLTGMRRNELCVLKGENIKLHLRQIHVFGKGMKYRTVGIHHSLMEECKARCQLATVIPSMHPSSISRAVKTVFRELQLPEALTLHSLRHTYISYLLEKGVPPKRVQERAGHFSLNVTARYSHALPGTTVDEDVLDFEV